MDEGGSMAKKILGGVMTIIERYNGVSVKNLFSNMPSFMVQLHCYNDRVESASCHSPREWLQLAFLPP